MVKVSRSGRPIRPADVAADDVLIDAVFTAPLHGSVTIDDGAGGELVRRLMAVRRRPQDLADGPAAGFVEARSCLNRVIAKLLLDGPGSQLSACSGRIPTQRDAGDRDVAAAIADAIAALDSAFESWLAVTEYLAPVRAPSTDENSGGAGSRRAPRSAERR